VQEVYRRQSSIEKEAAEQMNGTVNAELASAER
jgi:hypothetical protein